MVSVVSVCDLVASELEDPSIPLLSRITYGSDFVRTSLDVPSWTGSATWGLRNTYTLRGSSDTFHPVLVGTVTDLLESSPVSIRCFGDSAHQFSLFVQDTMELCIPLVSPGHMLDTVWWKQLRAIKRVTEIECSSDVQHLWDPLRYCDAPVRLKIEPTVTRTNILAVHPS
jgi:hypothetical protein